YHIETTLPLDAAQYVEALCEAMYAFYSQKFNVKPEGKLAVNVYAHFDEFSADAKQSLNYSVRPGEAGMFVPKKALYIPWVVQRSGLQPSAILLHEGFHQFYFSMTGIGEPKWFNEGLAVYFENNEFDGE